MIKLLTDSSGWTFAVNKGDKPATDFCEEHHALDIDRAVTIITPLLKLGDVVVDAGAHIGGHTVYYAKAVGETGKVYAFEPFLPSYVCLAVNCRDFPQVELFNCALGDVTTMRSMAIGDRDNNGTNFVQSNQAGTTAVLPLDSFQLPSCKFIKIDVEGYEPFVIGGAIETIRKFRPIIFCELCNKTLNRNGFTIDTVIQMMTQLDYTLKLTEPRGTLELPQVDVFFMP